MSYYQKHRLEVLTSKGIIFGEEFEVDPGSRKSIQIQSLDGNSTKHQGGFVSIFNGKDFTGWEVESGAPSSWAIKEGELCAIGVADDTEATLKTQGYLFSTKDYKDFVLRFQFLQANGPYDWSGVALRAIPHETVQCVEPLWTENIPWHLTAIVGKRSPTQSNAFVPGALLWTVGPMPFLPPDRLIDLRKPGEWNDFELELKGQFLRMTLNGTEIQNVMLNKVSRPQKFVPGLNRFYGRIGFMKRVGEVHYRNIEIKELNEDSDAKP
ncbi:DUF1080 domain-containing protein [Telmatocola sphagniphila]|uniref:DUF1080 domain-containing protein n=1 Tax=Telmatocola sphagniphila TaxID=1123043 RepID=A0A8E6B6M7_9BACT|nr:DUF1080 domain-containing protein [Telmatocola sphagniphila]QVL32686.1 DUF1080 domain-containing protein [Telmatocola sphagniphila]